MKSIVTIGTATTPDEAAVLQDAGGGPIQSSASVGRAKRQSFYVYRRISLLQLVGEGSLPNRRTRH
jgi:hypothetical protein